MDEGKQEQDNYSEAVRLRELARTMLDEERWAAAEYYNMAANIHATLAVVDELKEESEFVRRLQGR